MFKVWFWASVFRSNVMQQMSQKADFGKVGLCLKDYLLLLLPFHLLLFSFPPPLSLSLYLSHSQVHFLTHTNTYINKCALTFLISSSVRSFTFSILYIPFLFLPFVSLSLSLSLYITHSLFYSLPLLLTPTLLLSHSLAHSHTLTLSLSYSYSIKFSFSLFYYLSITPTLLLPYSFSL